MRKYLIDKSFVERLIELVKQKPILYDIEQSKNSNLEEKESTWQEIALELGVKENALKRKWKNLKDCYRKYLRAHTEQESHLKKVKSYRRWGWGEKLEFLRPHVNPLTLIDIHETFYDDDDIVDRVDIDDIKMENRNSDSASSSEKECYFEEVTPRERKRNVEECYIEEVTPRERKRNVEKCYIEEVTPKERKRNVEEYYIQEVTPRERKRRRLSSIKMSEEESRKRGLDAIEHIFLGYAKTIKTLPVKSQIYVKMKIAKLIMEEELKFL